MGCLPFGFDGLVVLRFGLNLGFGFEYLAVDTLCFRITFRGFDCVVG